MKSERLRAEIKKSYFKAQIIVEIEISKQFKQRTLRAKSKNGEQREPKALVTESSESKKQCRGSKEYDRDSKE